MPRVSVIVPVRDGAASLAVLLESLKRQDLDPDAYEVIVVDNASRDATAEVAAAHGVRVVSEPRPNRSRARNAGAAVAAGDVFAFIDADSIAAPDWLRVLLSCLEREGAPLIAGRIEVRTRAVPSGIERFDARCRFDQERAVSGGWAATANLLAVRPTFERIGGFDTEYRQYGEDADFCLRAGRVGFKLAYCDGAMVFQDAERDLRPVLRRAFFHGYGAVQALRRLGVGHIAWRDPRFLLPRRAPVFFSLDLRMHDPRDRRLQTALAMAAYASRVAGSLWASLLRVR